MNSKNHSVFYGWRVVLTAAVGLFWGVPITVYSFSVFLKPLMHEFGAGRAAVSLAYTFQSLMAAVSAPLSGRLIDRYGARKVILPGAAMFGLTLISMKTFSGGIWLFWILYGFLGLLLGGVGPLPYDNVVSHWFDRRRGLALGLTMCGVGCGAIIMPLLAQRLIATFGWRTAYAILGAAVLIIVVPVVGTFLKEKPEDIGLLPDGSMHADATTRDDTIDPGLGWHEAWHTKTFWVMLAAFFLVGASVQGCVVHLTAMLTDRAMTVQATSLATSLLGAAVLTGRLGSGYLLDRFFAPYLAALFFGGVAAGIAILWTGSATAIAFVGAFLVGLGLGAELDIIAYLASRYFGLRSFGTICGVAFGAFLLAGALGPVMMGAGFDLTGSYRGPLAAFFAATLSAAVLMTSLGPYRYGAHLAGTKEPILRLQIEIQHD
jgi:MFS family permease